ncbi:hypothetical protein HaLaN_01214 [Haematococcus lacustris]|uniref:Uncharacterized protein n=1 Tax=Haematococcus lacustris TaxID=44745 RepID=A0A699Y914_HAELA|nr:hypothetical protein HaLaN_01214 [Haematococcus lacustris]
MDGVTDHGLTYSEGSLTTGQHPGWLRKHCRCSSLTVRMSQHGLRITARLLASGALPLASKAMPAQAIADTPQLLTIDCSSGE